MRALKKLNLNKVAAVIEADAGQALPGLRESLAEAKAGLAGRVHTPEPIVKRRRGHPVGSVAKVIKEPVKLRMDPAFSLPSENLWMIPKPLESEVPPLSSKRRPCA